MSRRSFLACVAAFGSAAVAPEAAAEFASRTLGPVSLPDASQIKRDYAELVGFGPRLPGNANHVRFVRWLAEEFAAAGLRLGPCEEYTYRHWDPRHASLVIQSRDGAHAIRFPTPYVRSAPTERGGVTGRLVYGGRLGPAGPVQLGDVPPGAIVVFDGHLPNPTVGQLSKPVFINTPDGNTADF